MLSLSFHHSMTFTNSLEIFNIFPFLFYHVMMLVSPTYGPGRPFNFFGYLDSTDMDYLEHRLHHFAQSNHTFVLSHYPIATTLTGYSSSGASFYDLSRYFSVYLSGHLHKLAVGTLSYLICAAKLFKSRRAWGNVTCASS